MPTRHDRLRWRGRPLGLTGGPRKRKWPPMTKEKNNGNKPGGITKVEDIPSVIEALQEIYDEIGRQSPECAGPLSEDRRASGPEARAEGRCSPIPSSASTIARAAPADDAVARLRPAEPARPLCDQRRPARSLPRISDRAARAADQDYDVEVSVGRSARRSPIPMCSTARTTSARRRAGRRAGRAGSRPPSWPTSATRSPTATGTCGRTSRGRWRCSTARASTSAWRGCATTPAPRPSTPSATSCSPTTSAMSTSSCAWASRS